MPLGSIGTALLSKFKNEYGAKKGPSVFYAKENKGGKFAQVIKRQGKLKRRG